MNMNIYIYTHNYKCICLYIYMYVELMWPSRLQDAGSTSWFSPNLLQASLGQQAAVLRCAVAGVPVTSVPVILDMDDKHVFRLSSNLESARSQHVRQQEKKIKFGARQAWADVEADEVDLGKEVDMSKKAAKWEHWGGIVEGGHPKSLVPFHLNPETGLEAIGRAIPPRSQDHPPHRWGQNV